MRTTQILIVDDDPIFRFLHHRLCLSLRTDLEVRTAENGAAALEDIRQCIKGTRTLPDYIFLDMDMPEMDGREFLEVYKALSFPGKDSVKVAVVSTGPDPFTVMEYGYYNIMYFGKPLNRDNVQLIFDRH
jgi:CheY-like chemotaxis protein